MNNIIQISPNVVDLLLISPDQILDLSDKGTLFKNRFGHKYIMAAIMALNLLVDNGYSCFYCEHHEDILIRKTDVKYVSIQGKTKLRGSTDPHIYSSNSFRCF